MKKLALLLIIPFALLTGVLTASAQETPTPQAGSTVQATWNSYKPETIQGNITMIVVNQKLVVLTDSDGVPFNFLVTKKTKINIGGNPASFNDLIGQTHKQATVTFIARPKGDIAQSIGVSG